MYVYSTQSLVDISHFAGRSMGDSHAVAPYTQFLLLGQSDIGFWQSNSDAASLLLNRGDVGF